METYRGMQRRHLAEMEVLLKEALVAASGSTKGAAELLDISYTTFAARFGALALKTPKEWFLSQKFVLKEEGGPA